MRLRTADIAAIRQAACEHFPPGSTVTLFGSRLEDSARGGDIDLLIETPQALSPEALVKQRHRFVANLYRLLDEQRIDVLIVSAGQPDDRPVVATARREGQRLIQVPEHSDEH